MSKENKWQVTGRVASNLIVVFAGVAFYMALSNFDALRAQLRAWLGILSPFVWGLVIAYLLDAPVRFFESKLGGRRKLSILISYVLAFLVVGFLLRMVLPQIGNGFISAVTALISSVYMLMGKDRLLRQLRKALLAEGFAHGARRLGTALLRRAQRGGLHGLYGDVPDLFEQLLQLLRAAQLRSSCADDDVALLQSAAFRWGTSRRSRPSRRTDPPRARRLRRA